jgi:hypothetical protein
MALAQYIASTPRNGKYSTMLDEQRIRFEREFLAIGPGPRGKMAK